MDVEVQTVGNPMVLLPEIRRTMREIAIDAPVQCQIILQGQFRESYELRLLLARLGAFFGGLAAMLVALGLYETLAYRVNRRGMEIGLRMALGAARGQVLWMVFRESLAMVAGALMVGLPAAWAGSKLMATMLYGLSPRDPISLGMAAGGVLTVSLAATLIPARRAANVQPMRA